MKKTKKFKHNILNDPYDEIMAFCKSKNLKIKSEGVEGTTPVLRITNDIVITNKESFFKDARIAIMETTSQKEVDKELKELLSFATIAPINKQLDLIAFNLPSKKELEKERARLEKEIKDVLEVLKKQQHFH